MPALRRSQLDPDPFTQFASWFELAEREVPLAEAMTLATVDGDCSPDARMVLLKGFGPDGFRFFTSYESAKGEQLGARSEAALVVYWRELDRQVRARGTVERLPAPDSDAYFTTRARTSQLGAWASPQSRPLASRAELDERLREAERRFEHGAVPRPDHWGGYELRPWTIEFWQGRGGRLHDRFRYLREGEVAGEPTGEGWRIERLGP
jgi:pyridoxamine 5'-phosphate oxidase